MSISYFLREDPSKLFDQSLKQPTIKCRGVEIVWNGDRSIENFEEVVKCDSFAIFVEDREMLYTRDFLHAFGAVIALHYVFNLSYASQLQASMVFIQKLTLDLLDNCRAPTKVLQLISKVKNSNTR